MFIGFVDCQHSTGSLIVSRILIAGAVDIPAEDKQALVDREPAAVAVDWPVPLRGDPLLHRCTGQVHVLHRLSSDSAG